MGLDSDGWAVTYYGYSAPDDRNWFIPWMISFERYNLNPVLLVNSGFNKIQLSYWKPGLSYFYKLGKYFHANASFFVPIGNETLTKVNGKEIDSFLIGIHPSQGIYFISESNFGITMGVSIYEVLMNSEIYGGDFGVQVEFGLKF